jgi:hypothetical protein
MVYNFRIAQITKQPILQASRPTSYTVSALVFDQYRKKYTGVYQNFIGALGSFIYDFSSFYFRIDGAFSHILEKTDHVTTFAGTETDDILFTVGRMFSVNKHTILTASVLCGIPTHKMERLKHIDFGESLVGSGVQLDGSYDCGRRGALLYGTRYVYFVPRDARDNLGNSYRFTIGNIEDLFLAYKNNWGKHGGEFGYTARFRFGAQCWPYLADIIQKTNYIRSNVYVAYKYKFRIHKVPNRLIFNASYGRDHISKTYGLRYVFTLWGSWTVNF